jgi:hypothetical protein
LIFSTNLFLKMLNFCLQALYIPVTTTVPKGFMVRWKK